MNASAIDSLARGASVQQARRHTLKAIAAATLLAVAGAPLAAEAKSNNGNNKNKKKRRNRGNAEQQCPPEDCTQEAEQAAAARCQTQVAPCEQAILATCDGNAECLAGLRCCPLLGTCDAPGFFTCLIAPPQN